MDDAVRPQHGEVLGHGGVVRTDQSRELTHRALTPRQAVHELEARLVRQRLEHLRLPPEDPVLAPGDHSHLRESGLSIWQHGHVVKRDPGAVQGRGERARADALRGPPLQSGGGSAGARGGGGGAVRDGRFGDAVVSGGVLLPSGASGSATSAGRRRLRFREHDRARRARTRWSPPSRRWSRWPESSERSRRAASPAETPTTVGATTSSSEMRSDGFEKCD